MNNRLSRPTRVHPAQIARGPQSTAPVVPQPPAYPVMNAALLIDFDNVTMGIRSELASELKNLLSSDVVKGKIAIRRAYADWRRYPQYVLPLTETSIDLIYAPAYGSAKKNATDIRLAINAMELVFTRPEIGTIVLLSGDSDFSSLVIKLKEYGKYVIGVGIRESSSDLLVQNCDEYYSYNALAGLVKTGDEPAEKWDPWELAAEAVMRMKRNGDVMRADRLKQVMQEIDSNFDEKNTRHAKFSRFVAEAAQRGILHTTKLENGQLEVDLPRVADDATGASIAAAVPVEAAHEEVAPRAEETERPSGRERGRRRGGRDRSRGGARNAHAESREAPAATSVAATGVAPAASVAPPAAVAPVAAAAPAAPVGERLTRSEALDLLRRAVEILSGSSNKPLLANVVREKAQELLGRPSDTLSERHFGRILHDAHDAEVIDLKRRGEDLEVSRIAPAATVADKMNIASAAQTPAAPQSAVQVPTKAGMAGRAAFGKRRGEVPAHLLSIGVVDTGTKPSVQSGNGATEPAPAPAPVAAEKVAVESKGRGQRGRGGRGKSAAAAARSNGDAPAAAPKAAAKKAAKKAPGKRAAAVASSDKSSTSRRGRKTGGVVAGADA